MGMRVSVVAGGVGEPGRPPRSLCVHSPLQVAAAVVEEQPQADQQPSAAPTEAAASLPLPPAPLPLSSPSTTGQQPAEVSPLQAAASGGIGVLDQHGLLDVAAVAAPEEFDLLGDLGALLPSSGAPATPAAAVQATSVAEPAGFADLLGDLDSSLAPPLPVAAFAAGDDLQWAALGAALAEQPPAGNTEEQAPIKPAAAAAADAAPAPLSQEAGMEEGGLSDLEESGDEECPAVMAPAAAPAAQEAAEHAAAVTAEQEAAEGTPTASPDSGGSGLSDVATETDADADSAAAEEEQQQEVVEQQQPVAAPADARLTEAPAGMRQQTVGDPDVQGMQPLPSPPPQQLQQPQQPPPQQQAQQDSLLQAAERLERRLAAGGDSSSSSGAAAVAAAGEEEAEFRDHLLLASIISQASQLLARLAPAVVFVQPGVERHASVLLQTACFSKCSPPTFACSWRQGPRQRQRWRQAEAAAAAVALREPCWGDWRQRGPSYLPTLSRWEGTCMRCAPCCPAAAGARAYLPDWSGTSLLKRCATTISAVVPGGPVSGHALCRHQIPGHCSRGHQHRRRICAAAGRARSGSWRQAAGAAAATVRRRHCWCF